MTPTEDTGIWSRRVTTDGDIGDPLETFGSDRYGSRVVLVTHLPSSFLDLVSEDFRGGPPNTTVGKYTLRLEVHVPLVDSGTF